MNETIKAANDEDTTPFHTGAAADFAKSEVFARLFKDGMALVEETASYLDGEGRAESKLLSRTAALAYVSESMKLTTRLMQVASWLLVQRAVKEGDMTIKEAQEPKFRLPIRDEKKAVEAFDELPETLRKMIKDADSLYERVLRLDRKMYIEVEKAPVDSPVNAYYDALHAAFDAPSAE